MVIPYAKSSGIGARNRIVGASPTANFCKNTREGRTNEKAENASGANENTREHLQHGPIALPQRGPIASRKKS